MAFDVWADNGVLMIAIGPRPQNWSSFDAYYCGKYSPIRHLISWMCGGWPEKLPRNNAFYWFPTTEALEHFIFVLSVYGGILKEQVVIVIGEKDRDL